MWLPQIQKNNNKSLFCEEKNTKTKSLLLLWMCSMILLKPFDQFWPGFAGLRGWLDFGRPIHYAISHKSMWDPKVFFFYFPSLYTICWITCPPPSLIQVRQHNQSLSQCLQWTCNCSYTILPLPALWMAHGMGRELRVSTLRLHPPAIIRIYKCGIWTVFEGR